MGCVSALVSVIVPMRNAEATIVDLLESLAEQTVKGFEVVIVDNDSTDQSGTLVAGFVDRFDQLRVVHASAWHGPGYARRVGAEVASGDCLLFIDADDSVNRRYVEAMTDALSRFTFVHAAMDMLKHNPPWYVELDGGLLGRTEAVGDWKFAYGGTIGVRREEYDGCGGWAADIGMSEDTDFCWRMRVAGHDLHCVPTAVVHRRGRQTDWRAWRQGRTWGRFQARSNRIWRPFGLPVESEWTLLPRAVHLVRSVSCIRYRAPRIFFLKELGIVSARVQQNLSDWIFQRELRVADAVPRPSSDPTLAEFRGFRPCAEGSRLS